MCVEDIFSCCLACSGQTTRSYSVRAVMESDDVACLCLLCTSCAGRVVPVFNDEGLYRRGSGEGRGARCGCPRG